MTGPAMPPTRPALRARFDRRRDAIVDGAARIYARQGYDQTTMQELAASLGVATGAIYHYFPGKTELLRAICDELTEPLLRRAAELAQAPLTPEARLREFTRSWVAHVCARRDHMRVFQQERHQISGGADWGSVRAERKAFDGALHELLAEVATPHRRPLPRLALLGMVNHTADWYRPRGGLTPEQIADGYVDLLLGSS